LQAPLQLISGAHDPRCPASESIQAQQALQALDKPCELLLYPDEGHVFHQTRNRVDHLLRCEAFLARSLE
jgi:dipeptidyl aminopeptidase/acylaminoacyl peptidase